MSELGHVSHLMHAAMELTKELHKTADHNLPGALAGMVKLHAGIAVGSAFIPIPGLDLAAAATNVWVMYGRINSELEIPFGENIIKSVGAGIVTNLGAAGAGMMVGSALKFIPGIGTIGGIAVIAGTVYALTIASGIVYMKALTKLVKTKDMSDLTESDLKSAAEEVLKDKDAVKSYLKEGKSAYKTRD